MSYGINQLAMEKWRMGKAQRAHRFTSQGEQMAGAVRFIIVALTILLFSHPWLGSAAAGFREQVREEQLANGLTVILLESHRAPVVTFQVWYRVGSRNEAWGKAASPMSSST